jgi:hypothetical protein
MKDHVWFDAIGWVGAAALLVAYAMISSRKWEGHSSAFQLLNVGSLLQPQTQFLWIISLTFVNIIWAPLPFSRRHQEAGFVSLVS